VPNVSTTPDEPISKLPAKDSDIEMEERRDQAEALKLDALQDRLKDVERESRIEQLESAGDLLEQVRPIDKKGPFVRGDWDARDRGKITSAPVEKGWYAKSPQAQRTVLEKIMGTHRPTGRSGVRKHTPGKVDLVRPGSLKDKHPDAEVSRRDAEADALLIKAGDGVIPASPEPPECPAPTHPAIVGYCSHCGGPIDPEKRADSKFCSGAHRTAFFRREAQLDIARKAFKDYMARVQQSPHIPFYRHPPAPEPPPLMTSMHAIRSNQVGKYLMERKTALVTDNMGTTK
jgi:hypothetical protein